MDSIQKEVFFKRLALVSGVFSVVIALLLLLSYWNYTKTDPAENKTIHVLVEKLSQEPQSQVLVEEIRQLDLLARKAYFTAQWQLDVGGLLLLMGAVICFFALRMVRKSQYKIAPPEDRGGVGKQKKRVEQLVLFVGAALVVMSFLSSFYMRDYLSAFEPKLMVEASVVEEDQIETIEVSEEIKEVPSLIQTNEVIEDTLETSREFMVDSVASIEIVEEKEVAVPAEQAAVAVVKSASSPQRGLVYGAQVPAFRGPYGNGVFNVKKSPVDWDGASGKNIKWKVDVPVHGYSSPVIWGNHLLLTGGSKQSRIIYCFDKRNGDMLWQHEVKGIEGSPTTPPKVTDDTGFAASTLATDGVGVYAIFATGDVVSVDMTGKRLWAKNLGVPDNHYGHSSSLITWDSKLFIQYDTNKGSKLMAFNTKDGTEVWRTQRKTKISWASPVLAMVEGQMQVILSSTPLVAGYDAKSGKELWSVDCMMGEVGPSPAFYDGLVFAGNEYAKLLAIKPGLTPTVVWEDDEYLPEVASPVVANGLLFIATSYGVMVCYEAATGEKKWEVEADEGFYSSPVIANDMVYFADMSGQMHIYKVSEKPELVGKPELGSQLVTTPAFDENAIFLRSENSLFCISEE